MPRYYFHLRDAGDLAFDEEGRELAGLDAVATASLAEARSIMSADMLAGHLHFDQRIDVEDAQGLLAHRLTFEKAVEIFRTPGGGAT